ncbi:MAG TPA: hypothetical protein VD905_01345 [Flavobacteriales bacterium]|nr:hypothetical protein [Flavobacteriales bacterium]
MRSATVIVLFLIQAKVFAQSNLQFAANERENGTALFAMDGNTGQVYFMLDYGESAGMWKPYGSGIADLNWGYLFAATERDSGTAFFAMHQSSGQVYYMLDYGDYAGAWKSYGGTLPVKSKTGFTFDVNERKDGTAFFSLDKTTGQAYYMLDYGEDAGIWKPFGGTITK